MASKIGYRMCEAKNKMKMEVPLIKIIKDFRMMITEH